MLLLLMMFSSQQISASILHLYGQTLATGSEGEKPQQKTKKLFLGNEAEKLAPDEARKRLRKLVGQIFLIHVSALFVEEMDLGQINWLLPESMFFLVQVHLNT